MKVNIIIRVEDCTDEDQSVEIKFEECETARLLEDEFLKLIRPAIRQYVEMFEPKIP